MTPRVAKLLFDSAMTGEKAGARGFGYSARSLLYGNGDISIDILLVDGGYQLTILQGQVVKGQPGEPIRGARVQLGSNDCHTNEFGEFSVTLMGEGAATVLRVEYEGEGITCTLPELTPA